MVNKNTCFEKHIKKKAGQRAGQRDWAILTMTLVKKHSVAQLLSV
jgi:hypothetical protein